MSESQISLTDLKQQVDQAYQDLDIQSLKHQSKQLLEQISKSDFWADAQRAEGISKQQSNLQKRIQFWQNLKSEIDDLVALEKTNDPALKPEIQSKFKELSSDFEKAKIELLFKGQYDDNDLILSIYAGAGGTDAQDWAEMLLRMYLRYAEQNNLTSRLIDKTSGDQAGIKSATIELSGGEHLYGKMKSEHGVHRLVRLSPFNADNLRQTSFARVEIIPKISSPEQVEINPKDLKIDVYRSAGKGGQSVNTTDSAVRVTHLPTGLVVAIQNQRSQLQNKQTALLILRSKLAQLQSEQHIEKLEDLRGPNEQAAWGNQIRNYVLHPYQLVKDTRTKFETTNVQAVLDGQISDFIEAFLAAELGS